MNKKPLIFLSAVLSIVFMAAHWYFGYLFRFDNICFAARTGAGSFIVNDNGADITLLQMNDTCVDRADKSISYKKIFESSDGELGYNHPLDIVESGGKIYLLNMKKFFYGRSPEYEIFLLDFNLHRSEIIFSFSDEELGLKLKQFLADYENADPESDYAVCGETFGVDGGEISLCFAEQPAEYKGICAVYECKLAGGEIIGAEQITECRTDQSNSIMIVGKNALQLDNGYHLLIGGRNSVPLAEERYSELFRYDEGVVIGKSIDSGEVYRIDIAGEVQTVFTDIHELIENKALNFADISDLYMIGGSTVAVCSDGEKSYLFNVASGERLDRIYTEDTAGLILHSLISAAAAWSAVWLAGLLIYALRARGRVSVKFVALVIPVMLGCDLAAYAVIAQGMKVIEGNILQNSLKAVSTQYSSLALTDDIGDFGYEGEYWDKTFEFMTILVDSEYLKATYWTEDSGTSADVNFLGYIRGEELFALASDIIYGNYDVDIISLLPSKTAEKFTRAVESRSEIYCRIYDDDLERIVLISPTYFSGDGSVNGVFLYSVSAAEVNYSTKKISRRLMLYKLVLSAVIALLFTLSAVFPLRRLKKLQKKSADYLSGGYTPELRSQKPHGGCANEIDVISEKFDELMNSVYNDFNEIDNLRKANVAYFSDVILKIFNKKTINSIKFGESAAVEAYCIKALLPEKYSGFGEMNRLLAELGKVLKEHNAFAADIDSTELSVYSLEPEAINILFFLREYDSGILAAADKCYIDISIVNIGGGYRFNICREDPGREEILMNTLINTRAAAVVTESALDACSSDFSMICIGMADNRFIYEISDGMQKRFANSIRDYLKNGIERYFNGDHTAAREMFVMILKLQQDNPVARYYINLLDGEEREEALQ